MTVESDKILLVYYLKKDVKVLFVNVNDSYRVTIPSNFYTYN